MLYIGDVHGDHYSYRDLIKDRKTSIQVGDYGLGFGIGSPPEGHRFIRGNHDHPQLCKEEAGWIPDGTFEEATSTFFLGGAWSIDKNHRTWNIDWWPDEELRLEAFEEAKLLYQKSKPETVVTHDCPSSISLEYFVKGSSLDLSYSKGHYSNYQFLTRTGEFLEQFFRLHQPKLWVFGHWHTSLDVVVNGTQFVCLGIKEAREL